MEDCRDCPARIGTVGNYEREKREDLEREPLFLVVLRV